MRLKIWVLGVFFLFLLDNCLQCQTNSIEDDDKYHNLIKSYEFFSEGTYFPITAVICPYGFWFVGEIYLGYDNCNVSEHLKNVTFGWGINGIMVETPRSYNYDTIFADTISSKFSSVMCVQDSSKLQLKHSYNNELINISDSSSYACFANEFKYTYFLRSISFDDISDNEVIRIVYPTVSFPYKTSFDLVSLEILPDNIKMTSFSINTINLLDIKVKENGSVFLKTKDHKRFLKRIRKTVFNTKVDCNQCFHSPYNQFDFIVDYKNDCIHNSFFLCEGLKGNNESEKEIIDYLLGLKRSIVVLNENYFY